MNLGIPNSPQTSTSIKLEFDNAKTLLASLDTTPINYSQVKLAILTSLTTSNPHVSNRIISQLVDLLETQRISSEFVCVKVISALTTENFDIATTLLGCAARQLDNPNFYVNVSEDVAVHILIYCCMQLSPKLTSQNLDIILKLFCLLKSDLDSLAFKPVTDKATKLLTKTAHDTVKDFMRKTQIQTDKFDLSVPSNFNDPMLHVKLDKIPPQDTDTDKNLIETSILSRSPTVLSNALQRNLDLSASLLYKFVNLCLDTYNLQTLVLCLQLVNASFEFNSALSYCLINKILFAIEMWSPSPVSSDSSPPFQLWKMFKDMLIVCSNSLSVSFDETQWKVLTRFGYDKEIMKKSYIQFSDSSVSTSLRDLCSKLEPKWLHDSNKDEILSKLKAFQDKMEDTNKSGTNELTIRSTCLTRLPTLTSNYDTPDCIMYTDETGTNFAFTSTSIESLLMSKTNPYTGLQLKQEFLDGLAVFRAINRRLSLLKYQFTHEASPRELISSYQSVFCTKSVIQTAKLFATGTSHDDTIIKMKPTLVFEVLRLIGLEPENLFPRLGPELWALGKVNNDDSTDFPWILNTDDVNFISKHTLNTICQLIYSLISNNIRLAKIFYCKVLNLN